MPQFIVINAKIVVNTRSLFFSSFLVWPLGKGAHQAASTHFLTPCVLKLDTAGFSTVLRQINKHLLYPSLLEQVSSALRREP